MGALPKRKTSKARKGKRSAHSRMRLPALEPCSRCHSMKRTHHACPTCGTYAGQQAIEVE